MLCSLEFRGTGNACPKKRCLRPRCSEPPERTIARHFRCANGVDVGVDPSPGGSAQECLKKNEVHTVHARGAIVRSALAGGADGWGCTQASESKPRWRQRWLPRGGRRSPPWFCLVLRQRSDGGGLYPIPLLHEEPVGRGGRVRQRRGSRCAKIRATHEALTALKQFSKDILENPLIKCKRGTRCLPLASRWLPGADAPSSAEGALSALLRRMTVYGDDGPSNTLVPFSADLVSVLEDLDDAPGLLEVLPQVSRRFLGGGEG